MFTKEERLFIWKKVYENIERLEDGDYICVMLRNIVFKFFSTPKKCEYRTCKEWCETRCGIILPLFTQGQKSHEFSNGLRVGNKE